MILYDIVYSIFDLTDKNMFDLKGDCGCSSYFRPRSQIRFFYDCGHKNMIVTINFQKKFGELKLLF